MVGPVLICGFFFLISSTVMFQIRFHEVLGVMMGRSILQQHILSVAARHRPLQEPRRGPQRSAPRGEGARLLPGDQPRRAGAGDAGAGGRVRRVLQHHVRVRRRRQLLARLPPSRPPPRRAHQTRVAGEAGGAGARPGGVHRPGTEHH